MEADKFRELANSFGLTRTQFLDFLFQRNLDSKINLDKINHKIESLLNEKKTHKNDTGIKKFVIYDLFEKNNNYSFNFEDDINIFISENGIGKTSILKLFIAILEKDASTINEIEFSKVILQIDKKEIVIDKAAINEQLSKEFKNCLILLRNVIERKDYEKLQLCFEINKCFNSEKVEDEISSFIRENRGAPYIYKRAQDCVHELNQSIRNKISESVNSSIDSEILFFPTYRKIETSKSKIFSSRLMSDVKVINKHISFGMREVEERIESLLDEIRISTNISYSTINGEVINDLFDGSINDKLNINKIDLDKFKIVIDRIGRTNIENPERIEQFIEKPNEEKTFLLYYIQKLISIYDKQEKLTNRIKSFISVCNKYLTNKEFIFNESELRVDIKMKTESVAYVELEDLSSGEKQLISLFSKIYLDVVSPCIFVIDEPELSLSIEWQKQFLIDIYNSHRVGMLIATTHSPFIFDNDFFEFTQNIENFKKLED